MKYAVLKYSSRNLGDDFQSLALENLLPRVDYRIDRDDMSAAQDWGDDVRWIINGWFAPAKHKIWPPPGRARKLFIGFHAVSSDIVPRNEPSPLGCRDPWTLDLCNQSGIDAWLSWCLTLTLQRPPVLRDDSVVLADVPGSDLKSLPRHRPRYDDQSAYSLDKQPAGRSGAAPRVIRARARWVVTTRLHVLLPCVAFGTPVVFLRPPAAEHRYFGYLHLGWKVSNAPWDTPRPRADAEYVWQLGQPLRTAVRRFIES